MWIWLAVASAFILGIYDVAKKEALKRNGVLTVLLCATALSTLFLSPFLKGGSAQEHLMMALKAILVTASWVSGLAGLKLLPITTASTIKASRPVLVVIFSLILFGEKLNLIQWGGVLLAVLSLYLLSCSSEKEGISFRHNRGIAYMAVSVFSGVASALFDKYIMLSMEPLFVQSWANFYTTIMLAVCLLSERLMHPDRKEAFRWDWLLVVIAVLITAADFLYFTALNDEEAQLSMISLARRGSVIVTFALGAVLFREHRIAEKAVALAVMLCAIVLIVIGSL